MWVWNHGGIALSEQSHVLAAPPGKKEQTEGWKERVSASPPIGGRFQCLPKSAGNTNSRAKCGSSSPGMATWPSETGAEREESERGGERLASEMNEAEAGAKL